MSSGSVLWLLIMNVLLWKVNDDNFGFIAFADGNAIVITSFASYCFSKITSSILEKMINGHVIVSQAI